MHPLFFITDEYYIPSYMLILSMSFTACVIWVSRRTVKMGLSREVGLDLCLALMVGAMVGSRLMHVIYEEPRYYWNHPIEIFHIWNGGYVFLGGLLLAIFLGWLVVLWRKQSFLEWGDFFAPVGALGYSFGRWACFFNGCCYGHASNLPWALTFPDGPASEVMIPRHPTQIYMSLWELGVFLILVRLEKWKHRPRGFIFFSYISLHGLGRLVVEQFRGDYRGAQILNISVSSWISIGLLVVGIFFLQRCLRPLRTIKASK